MHAETSPTNTLAILRRTLPHEVPKVMAFYETHASGGLVLRREDEHELAARDGLHFLVEARGAIVAAGACFEEGPRHLEIGNTLVAPAFRGLGFQGLLIRLRVVAATIRHGEGRELVAACNPGSASYRNCRSAGFEPWPQPPARFLQLCDTCPRRGRAHAAGRRCCCDFLRLSTAGRRGLIRSFLRDGCLLRSTGPSGAAVAVEVRTRYATTPAFLDALAYYAGDDLPGRAS